MKQRTYSPKLMPMALAEMNEVHGGAINMSGVGVQILNAIVSKNYSDLVDLGFVIVCDEGGGCTW